jgi:hypothetical protein
MTLRLPFILISGVTLLLVSSCRDTPSDEPTRTSAPPSLGSASKDKDGDSRPSDELRGDTLAVRTVARVDSVPQSGPGDARSRIVFSDSTSLEVPFRDAQLVLELPVPGASPWLLVAGVECSDCDAITTLWFFRAQSGVMRRAPFGYSYPGEMTEAGEEESTPYFRSRLFVGACGESTEPVAIWLEEELAPEQPPVRRARVLRAVPTAGHAMI